MQAIPSRQSERLVAKKEKPLMTFDEFRASVNDGFGAGIIQSPGANRNLRRLCTGFVGLDGATGGGWPFSRINIIAGAESSGKTLRCLKAAEQVKEYDKATHVHKSHFKDLTEFTPGTALFVDVENSFDEDWAVLNGWDMENYSIAVPASAEQTVDLVTKAIEQRVFDLIIVDSIAAMTPDKEYESSSEDWQMGLGARLTNKAMRKWNAALAKATQDGVSGPCVLALNQFREKLGIMYGDNRTLPNGKGQRFAAAIIEYCKPAQVQDDSKTEFGEGIYGGVMNKNKTFTPKCTHTFTMALKGDDKGKVNNAAVIVKLCADHGMLTKDPKSGWNYGSTNFRIKRDFIDKLEADPDFMRRVWRDVVMAFGADPW